MKQAVNNFFTLESFGVFALASAMVLLTTNAWRLLLGRKPEMLALLPWVAFVASMVVSLAGAAEADALSFSRPLTILVAFFNGLLLFCSAAGAQETIAKLPEPTDPTKPKAQSAVKRLPGSRLKDSFFAK